MTTVLMFGVFLFLLAFVHPSDSESELKRSDARYPCDHFAFVRNLPFVLNEFRFCCIQHRFLMFFIRLDTL